MIGFPLSSNTEFFRTALFLFLIVALNYCSQFTQSAWAEPARPIVFAQTSGGASKTEKWDRHWQQLTNTNGEFAWAAMRDMLAKPSEAVAFLAQKLHPAKAPQRQNAEALIAKLNSEEYRERIRAFVALRKLGNVAQPALKVAARGSPSLEVTIRARALLEFLVEKKMRPQDLRIYRALELLEYFGDNEAKLVLYKMAGGAAGTWQTEEAQASLKRLRQRKAAFADAKKLATYKTLNAHTSTITSLKFSPNGKWLASGSYDDTVLIWDLQTGRQKMQFRGPTSNIYAIAFSKDSKIVMSAHSNRIIYMWNIAQQKQVGQLGGHTSTIRTLAASPDGRLLASAGSDRTIRLWDIPKKKLLASITGHTSTIYGLAFSADGKLLASSSADRTIRVWDVASRRQRMSMSSVPSYSYSIAFSRDGKTLIAGDTSNRMRSWEIATGTHKHSTASMGRYLALHPNGKLVAGVGSGLNVRVLDWMTGRIIANLKGHQTSVRAIDFHPQGTMLAVCSSNRTIHIWRVRKP